MTSLKVFGTVLFLAFSVDLLGQINCDYKIDTISILLNENLDSFVSKIQKKTFTISYDKKDIPPSLKVKLDCFANDFSIANRDEEYQATCTIKKKLPERQLQFLGISDDTIIMTYLTGGVGVCTHILFVKLQGDTIKDLWAGTCLSELTSKKDILNYIKKNKNRQWGLQTNFVYI